MRNIELKVKIYNFKELSHLLKKIGGKYKYLVNQTDTYYNCGKNYLKIRETNKKFVDIIYYQRPNKFKYKVSNYQIWKLSKVQIKTIKTIFKNIFGIKVMVIKKREVWQYKNTRIHLDQVNFLGRFLELETIIIKNKFIIAKKEYSKIIRLLNLLQYKKYANSYCDLLLEKRKS